MSKGISNQRSTGFVKTNLREFFKTEKQKSNMKLSGRELDARNSKVKSMQSGFQIAQAPTSSPNLDHQSDGNHAHLDCELIN